MRHLTIRSGITALAVVAATAVPGLAIAAGAGGHEPRWSLTLWGFANFAIYCFLMWKFAWPLIKDYLQDRRDEVVNALEAAARAKKEAEQLKAEFDLRMKSLEDEAKKAQAEILEIAQNEAQKMVEQAEKTAEHIRRDAQLVADQEVARARRALQEESANLVTQIAAEMVSAQITTDDQDRFVKDFLAQSQEESR